MNNTKKTTLAIVAILTAATLVVGTLATTTTLTQTAFAYSKNKKDNGKGNDNGNTITIQKCKQAATQSGFDNNQGQECENLICTHPGENATCVQEGVVTPTTTTTTTTPTPTPTPTPEPITTTLRIIKQVVCQPGSNCSLPSDCTISLFTSPPSPPNQQSFTCNSAIGNGVLFTLQPGDSFTVFEAISGGFTVSTSGDCGPSTIAAGQHVTCTIINTEIPG
jgi:hypothetical protein